MIAIDTNVLVRFAVHDDEGQATAAERLFVRARREQHQLFVADAVLCEFAWVLASRYKQARRQIAHALLAVMQTDVIAVTAADEVEAAIRAYAQGKGDFADYLIRERSRAAGATEVVTFDRALRGEDGFRVIGG